MGEYLRGDLATRLNEALSEQALESRKSAESSFLDQQRGAEVGSKDKVHEERQAHEQQS